MLTICISILRNLNLFILNLVKQNLSHPLFYDSFQLEQVTSIKFLGIYISDTLTWDAHINYSTRKISKISGSLFKMRQCIPRVMIRQVYFALVNSQLIYGINVWGSAGSASNLSKLFAAQKKAIRTLFHIRRLSRYIPGHTKDVFSKNKILTVHNLYFLSTLKCTFLAIYSSPPTPIINQIKSHVSNRKSNLFILPKQKLSNHQKNYPYINFKVWNSFINTCSCLDIFDALMLSYWKADKFNKVCNSFLLHFQSLGDSFSRNNLNLNLFDIEAGILTGNLNPGSIVI